MPANISHFNEEDILDYLANAYKNFEHNHWVYNGHLCIAASQGRMLLEIMATDSIQFVRCLKIIAKASDPAFANVQKKRGLPQPEGYYEQAIYARRLLEKLYHEGFADGFLKETLALRFNEIDAKFPELALLYNDPARLPSLPVLPKCSDDSFAVQDIVFFKPGKASIILKKTARDKPIVYSLSHYAQEDVLIFLTSAYKHYRHFKWQSQDHAFGLSIYEGLTLVEACAHDTQLLIDCLKIIQKAIDLPCYEGCYEPAIYARQLFKHLYRQGFAEGYLKDEFKARFKEIAIQCPDLEYIYHDKTIEDHEQLPLRVSQSLSSMQADTNMVSVVNDLKRWLSMIKILLPFIYSAMLIILLPKRQPDCENEEVLSISGGPKC